MTVTDAQTRRWALVMSEVLDHAVLQSAATGSAYTGLMFCTLTSWGFFRFTWVAVKLGVTIGGLYLGIAHLGQWLHAGVQPARQVSWGRSASRCTGRSH